MAAKLLTVRIVTPEETFFEGEALSLVAPGGLGYLGILVNHAPLVTSLKNGRISLRTPQNEEKGFNVSGGVLEVSDNTATILTETVSE